MSSEPKPKRIEAHHHQLKSKSLFLIPTMDRNQGQFAHRYFIDAEARSGIVKEGQNAWLT